MSKDPKIKVLETREKIQSTVRRMSEEIHKDFAGENPLLVGMLKGSFIFMADLVRLLDFPLEVDFLGLASYGAGTKSSGTVRVTTPLRIPVQGRHVILVEDIVDTGLTTKFALGYVNQKDPASLKLCCLLDKPSRREISVPIDYLGLTIPDKFVVGYGIDWNERYRNLPDISFIDEEEENVIQARQADCCSKR